MCWTGDDTAVRKIAEREISMFIKQGRLYGIIFLLVILEDITMLLYVPIKQFL